MAKISVIKKISWLFILNIFILSVVPVSGSGSQSEYKTGEVSVRVIGTSTLHDWEMESDKAESQVRFRLNDDGEPENVESVVFRLQKTTLKSDKSGLDRRAYEALNANRHPEIIFRSNGTSDLDTNGDRYAITTSGNLTIAGVTREVTVNATCTNGDDNILICTGTSDLNMSDFNIDPPVMFLGTLRTGDEISIEYRITFTR